MVHEMLTDTQMFIPNLLDNWPWPRQLNPYHAISKSESDSWAQSFNAFDSEAQHVYNKCNFSLLGSLAFPTVDKNGCRIVCDLMHLFFVFDEYSDVASASVVQSQADSIMDAMRNPTHPRPQGESILGEMARQFWENVIRSTTPTFQHRFIAAFQEYTDAVVQQALDRDHHNIRKINQYLEIRRDTIGIKPSLTILESQFNLPDEVMRHPSLIALQSACVDMVAICNDLVSYNNEQARGDEEHNLVTIVMREHKCSLTDAFTWISSLNDNVADTFLSVLKTVPSFGDRTIDEQVAFYIDGLRNWVRGNDTWSFESGRYFGVKGLEIQKKRMVDLLPRRQA
ncbi:hypothetical protein QCA50_006291 [Cerrena zonata]|uniref:Terpene synthase n=1 Tax=Cerrena zonata TaxID=2478898 RepID=A0AAW0GLV4_9APHY